ncbi:hypothetical protein SEETMRM10961_18045 [Salmonella enterica subsp. enterica serovar Typhimurium]|nr:hypothetical protein SEETMRM10961_18045 [Salmonella enterica subsp. enterica serovar Typhimurium]
MAGNLLLLWKMF